MFSFYLFPPTLVLYIKGSRPGSVIFGPIVRVEDKTDKGLIMHERVHALQWWSMFWIATLIGWVFGHAQVGMIIGTFAHLALYNVSDSYLVFTEMAAYSAQLRFSKNKIIDANRFAKEIVHGYRTTVANKITEQDIFDIWLSRGLLK